MATAGRTLGVMSSSIPATRNNHSTSVAAWLLVQGTSHNQHARPGSSTQQHLVQQPCAGIHLSVSHRCPCLQSLWGSPRFLE